MREKNFDNVDTRANEAAPNAKTRLSQMLVGTSPAPDEREQSVNTQALAAVGVVGILGTLVTFFYRAFTDKNPLPDIIVLCAMALVYVIVCRKNKVYEIPKSFTGKTLDTSLDKKGRLNRIKYYMVDSLTFAIACTVIDRILSEAEIKSLVVNFIGLFVVSLVLDYFWTEHTVKKYNSYLDSLDEEEDDLD